MVLVNWFHESYAVTDCNCPDDAINNIRLHRIFSLLFCIQKYFIINSPHLNGDGNLQLLQGFQWAMEKLHIKIVLPNVGGK